MKHSKLGLRGCGMLDILSVLNDLPDDECDQLYRFGVHPRPTEMEDVVSAPSELAAHFWAQGEPRFCLCENETLNALVVGGFARLRRGVYRTWMLAKPEAFERYGAETTMNAGNVLVETANQLGAHRVECVVLASRLHARKWYTRLGFAEESIMSGYGVDGSDAAMYVYRGI